jgi:hypothetical protein
VCWGNCKVFAKKILPPDKKIIINARSVEIFFAKLCITLQGAWEAYLCLRFYYYHQYYSYIIHFGEWSEVYTKRLMVLVGGYSRQMFPSAVVGSVRDSVGGFGVCFCLCVSGNGRDGKNIGQIREGSKMTSCKSLFNQKLLGV